jgi:hypothetical protein
MRVTVLRRKKSHPAAEVRKAQMEQRRAKTGSDFSETIREFHHAVPERLGESSRFMSEADKKIYERAN